MIGRFCGYTTLRNLRFFEPFFVLYLLMGLGLPYVAIGGLLAYEKVLVGLLEGPLGVAADRWGRRRGVIAMFLVTGAAFAVYGVAASSGYPLAWLWVGQTLYGVGESLRTGTHKAIMLDWLDSRGMGDRSTSVIGLTRVFSKTSAGVAALVGGVLVWQSGSFVPLFWAAVVPCVIGAALVWSYPRELEGEWTRASRSARAERGAASDGAQGRGASAVEAEGWWSRFRRVLSGPGLLGLVAASVLFETQIKLAMVYLQPYLARGVNEHDLAVVGGLGALAIGGYYLLQGVAAGASSSLGRVLERRLGGRERSLRVVYGVAVGCFVLIAVSLWAGVLWPGIAGLLALACLQNARRPIFVSRLNAVMDPFQRSTTLSVESQARSWLYAGLAVGTGALADHSGLAAVFTLLAALIGLGLIPRWLAWRRGGPGSQEGNAPASPVAAATDSH